MAFNRRRREGRESGREEGLGQSEVIYEIVN